MSVQLKISDYFTAIPLNVHSFVHSDYLSNHMTLHCACSRIMNLKSRGDCSARLDTPVPSHGGNGRVDHCAGA